MKKFSQKKNDHLATPYWWLVFTLIAVIVLTPLGLFLYTDVYQILGEIRKISVYKKEVSPVDVDLERMNRFLQYRKRSTEASGSVTWDEIRDPFRYDHVTQP